jgi:hypothetical protein
MLTQKPTGLQGGCGSLPRVAVCNLASIGLPMFITEGNKSFVHDKLMQVTKVITRNLNKVIDVNYYPVPEAKNSNMRHSPNFLVSTSKFSYKCKFTFIGATFIGTTFSNHCTMKVTWPRPLS